jgi:lysophospholipase L1-like esterase
MEIKTYLALGDSYTIGEQVPVADSFPYQTVQVLRKSHLINDIGKTAAGVEDRRQGFQVAAPEIIAKTGWTTDELITAVGQTIFLPKYDIVSLLIGVNNQYRGRPLEEFKNEFELLLKMAIQFAGGNEKNVYVLSIPDWGVTPFAKDRDAKKIATEIDAFNLVCEKAAAIFKTQFINITTDQRKDGNDVEFLAADGLHPSGMEYKKWALKLSQLILANIV